MLMRKENWFLLMKTKRLEINKQIAELIRRRSSMKKTSKERSRQISLDRRSEDRWSEVSQKDIANGGQDSFGRYIEMEVETYNKEFSLPQRTPRVVQSLTSGPRILSNVQIVPPKKTKKSEWMEVVRKGKNRKDKNKNKDKEEGEDTKENKDQKDGKRSGRRNDYRSNQENQSRARSQSRKRNKTPIRKSPRTLAITITGQGQNFLYNEVLRKARQNIELDQLGIPKTKIRKAANRGYIIEMPGPDNSQKADELASKLREVLDENKVRIARPTIKSEIRIVGFDASVTQEEISRGE